MNTKQALAIILTSGLLLSGCTSEETLQVETLREVSATLNGFNQDESITRTAYNISETSGFQTVWAEGDVLGIYPIGGDQVSFPISEGVGTTTAKFDGGSWALRGTYKYAAYYPFSTDYYTIDQKTIPVSLLGQVQTGSNATAHLAAYDFMAAAGTQPSSNGSVDLQFNHVGCFLRMQFTMPMAGTYISMNIETDGGSFTTKGTVNLAATTPALTAITTSNKLTLGLNNVTTTAANQTIILYMMVAPDNLSAHTLTFTVEDNAGNTYTKAAAGKNMIATYAYNYSLALEATGTGGSTGGGGWGEGPNMHNGHEYVDLGLSSGLKWAACNVGATKSYEYGDYFAWGEIEPKNIYTRETYKYMDFIPGTPAEYDTDGFLIQPETEDHYEPQNIGEDISGTQYDAARQNWGGSWRMPTREEYNELWKKCDWRWTQMLNADNKPVNGYKVTGLNGNWIFLPAAGKRDDSDLVYDGSGGRYWSSRLNPDYPNCPYYFIFGSSSRKIDSLYERRYSGLSIRPVTE